MVPGAAIWLSSKDSVFCFWACCMCHREAHLLWMSPRDDISRRAVPQVPQKYSSSPNWRPQPRHSSAVADFVSIGLGTVSATAGGDGSARRSSWGLILSMASSIEARSVASDCFHSNSEARAIASLTNPAINCELRTSCSRKESGCANLSSSTPAIFPS